MKYKKGDKVLIVSRRTECMNHEGKMDKWLGKVMTIRYLDTRYRMEEDIGEHEGEGWYWYEEMIECVASTEAL